MKRFSTLFISFTIVLTALKAQTGTNYSGNGGSGFGGGIGGATLNITDNNTTINFTLTPTSAGFSGNVLVIYLDTKTGGVSSNSTFTDQSDGGRTAISGLSNSGRTLATFPSGFAADYAITIEPSSTFAGVFDLSTPSNFGFVSSANLAVNGSTLTFNLAKANVNLTSSAPFSFLGSLISTTAYRSNETFGASVTTPGSPGDSPNAGFTGSTTFSTFFTYTSQILPLKLVSFTGEITDNNIVINWVTSNEEGVHHFIVEGSSDANGWKNLAVVNASNTSSATYSQTVTRGTNRFYRLRIVDKDGKTSFSPVLNLKSANEKTHLISNPAIASIRLYVNAEASKFMTTLYTMEGKEVLQTNYTHPGGISTMQIPAGNLPKGNYTLRVMHAGQVETFKVWLQ